MQDIVFYAAANETLGVVRDYANSRNEYAPTLVLGVSVCLRMRLFAGSESAAPFPVDSLSGITGWKWRMDSDFDRETPYKLTADNNSISVQTVTDTIDGETLSFTEFAIPISVMNTVELATWLGTEKKRSGLTGELVGYDSSGNAVFVLQIDDFTVRNRIAGLNEPTSNDQEYLTRSETENLVSSAAAAKQDKLTSANAGAGITIDSGGTIGMACVILGATNGVKIADSKVQFDVATVPVRGGTVAGVLVDVAGGLQVTGGTASIDGASMEDVLTDSRLISGTTVYKGIADKVVTPGNLRGALSLGQAVDVSCAPTQVTWPEISTDGGANWETVTFAILNSCYLDPFSLRHTPSVTGSIIVGYVTFPKFADGLKYLIMCDVRNSGAAMGGIDCTTAEKVYVNNVSTAANGTTYGRFAFTTVQTLNQIKTFPAAANTNMRIDICNWRQYEVTALTDEAIEYLAKYGQELDPDTQLPLGPDRLFRDTSVFNVRDRYLVKQDMVCPWIYTINMDDNKDLTVAAGLSYKIKYTNDNAHKITVDTIPANAYGWDAHIQMFVKGTAAVQFQPPLVLMDALKPDAGNNLLVKFRNGQALVYVDDTNAGYIVISATGTTSGTLAYGLTMTPENVKDDKYIIFGSTVNGLVCDFGAATPVYGEQSTAINLIGNGMDQTTITGTLTVPSDKTVNMQDLSITGSTINGSGTVVLESAEIRNNLVADSGSTVSFAGVSVLDSTISGPGHIQIVNGATVSGAGTIDLTGNTQKLADPGSTSIAFTLDGITITGCTTTNGAFDVRANSVFTLSGVTFSDNAYCFRTRSNAYSYLNDCVFVNNTASLTCVAYNVSVNNITLDNTVLVTGITSYFAGNINMAGSAAVTTDTLSIVLSGSTIDATGSTVSGDGVCILYGFQERMGMWQFRDNVTLKAASGVVINVDALYFTKVNKDGVFYGTRTYDSGAAQNIYITGSTVDPWKAANAVFASPLDAHEASTVQLSGTTFTNNALILDPPARIQLVAGTTVSLSGNTNSSDTKILQAAVMVVGDNAAAPSGNATVVNAAGTSSTISGIGTYIDKEGDNDFTAIGNVKSVTVSSGATTVASSLASALALTTSSGGQNRWVKLANNLTATATYADGAAVTDKRIITAEYEPVLAGNFSFSSGAAVTFDEATRTTTVTGGITLSSACIPKGATVKVSGGSLAIEHMSGAGGTIELAGSNSFQMTSGTIGRVVVSSGATVNLTSGIVPDGGIALYGGASLSPTTIVCSGGSRRFEDVEIRGATISEQGIIYGATVYSNVGDDHYVYYTGDGGETSNSVIITGSTEYVVPGGLVRIVGT